MVLCFLSSLQIGRVVARPSSSRLSNSTRPSEPPKPSTLNHAQPHVPTLRRIFLFAAVCLAVRAATGQELSTNSPAPEAEPLWKFHAQNTDIVQYHPGITAPYAGPNSLSSANEVKETVSLDLLFGLRLWPGAEAHVDALMW